MRSASKFFPFLRAAYLAFLPLSLLAQATASPAEDSTPLEVPCADVSEPELCAELVLLWEEDQDIRRRLVEAPETEREEIHDQMADRNRRHLARVVEILEAGGWPGVSRVGFKASQGAWLIIQHSDLETQQRYLPLMREAAEQGELPGHLLATTIDRVLVGEGKKQLYGTQFTRDANGRLVPQPIEDPERVDQRREEMDLGPLEEAVESINGAYRRPESEAASAEDQR